MAELLDRNFNTAPYFDDSDKSISKLDLDVLRLLFRPSVAVQARELTQIQTLLQSQLGRFANHIFVDGTSVSGGQITTNTNVKVLTVTLSSGTSFDDFESGDIINISVNGKRSKIEFKKFDTQYKIYVSSIESELVVNDVIQLSSDSTKTATVGSISNGSIASISAGIFYVGGFFIKCEPQTISLSDSSDSPSTSIGLAISDEIITENTPVLGDIILDNARGTKNDKAPGAHRYHATLTLASRDFSVTDDRQTFIELAKIKSGKLDRFSIEPIYSEIGRQLAHRTFEESGNYVVEPFSIDINSHSTDNNKLTVSIGDGQAYVGGYERDIVGQVSIDIDRARDSEKFAGIITQLQYGHYFRCTTYDTHSDYVAGQYNIIGNKTWDLHCVPTGEIDDPSAIYGRTKIGTATVVNVIRPAPFGNDVTAEIRIYTRDRVYTAITGTVAATTAAGNNSFTATVTNNVSNPFVKNAYKGLEIEVGGELFVVTESSQSGTILTITVNGHFDTEKTSTTNWSIKPKESDVKSMVLVDNNTVGTRFDVLGIEGRGGKQNLIFPMPNNYLKSFGSTESSRELNFYTTDRLDGKSTTSGLLTVATGAVNGPRYYFGRNIASIITASEAARYVGIITAFSSNTNNVGNVITFSGGTYAANGSITLNVHNDDYDDVEGVSIVCPRLREESERSKTKNGLVVPDSHYSENNNGYVETARVRYLKVGTLTSSNYRNPINLYTSDVYNFKVVSLVGIDDASNTSLNQAARESSVQTEYTTAYYNDANNDITNLYSLDNGQRDWFYDHANVKLREDQALSEEDYIRVTGPIAIHFECYTHGSIADNRFFSINSYLDAGDVRENIPTYYSHSENVTYNLADVLDFRPVRSAGTGGTLESTYAPDPTLDAELTNGYEYYVPRKDRIVLESTTGGVINLRGEPSLTPELPPVPITNMPIFDLDLPPYTAKPGDVGVTAIDNRVYNMSDISRLDVRIAALEERADVVESRTIAQESIRSNSRYEQEDNITDFYANHMNGLVNSSDYRCSIDPIDKYVRPSFKMREITLEDVEVISNGEPPNVKSAAITLSGKYLSNTSIDSNTVSTNILTLPYDTENFLVQDQVNDIVHVNPYPVGNFNGGMLIESYDTVWYDRETTPRDAEDNYLSSEWREWLLRWVGIGNTYRKRNRFAEVDGRVVDLKYRPYAKVDEVKIYASNLRPNSNVHLYVDNTKLTTTTLSASDTGEVNANVSIDSGTLVSGLHTLRLYDNDSANVEASTTKAEAPFYVGGLPSKGRSNTLKPDMKRTTHAQSNDIVPSYGDLNHSSEKAAGKWVTPLCQTFNVQANQFKNGLFLTDIELFFASVPSADNVLPISVSIRPLASDGYPSQSIIINGSEVTKVVSTTISEDSITRSSTPERFTFHHPIYLPVGEYAICIETNSSEYSLYSSRIGEPIINAVSSISPEIATITHGRLLLPTNTGSNLFAVNYQLMFKLNKANFTATKQTYRWRVDSTTHANDDAVRLDYFLVAVDDVVLPGTSIKYYENNGPTGGISTQVLVGTNKTITPPTSRTGIDLSGTDSERPAFAAVFETTDTNVSPVIDTSRVSYVYITNEINDCALRKQDLVLTDAGEGYAVNDYAIVSTTSDSNFSAKEARINVTEVDSDGAVTNFSVGDNGGWLGGETVETITVVTSAGTNASFDIINSETNSSGGSAAARYISNIRTAEKPFNYLEVAIDGVKRNGGDMAVYYRLLSDSDSDVIFNRPWTRMKNYVPKISNSPDEFRTNIYYDNDTYTGLTYTSGSTTYNEFSTYQVKVTFFSPFKDTSANNVPKVRRIYTKTSIVG